MIEPLYYLLVVVAAALYFGQEGMFYAILPHSGSYLYSLLHLSRERAPGRPGFVLDMAAVRVDQNEYGAGPFVACAGQRAIAVTTPVLRLMVPTLQAADSYTVTASLMAPLGKQGEIVLLVGSDWGGRAAVRGDGTKETVSWNVPGSLLSHQAQSLRFCPDWGMVSILASSDGPRPVWFYLTGLTVVRPGETTPASGNER